MRQNGKFLFIFLVLSLFISCAQAPQQLVSGKPVAPVVGLTSEKIRDSIVWIESENASGTGFFIAPDKIATNIHSVVHTGPVSVTSPDKKKNWVIEGVVAFDTKNKLVILKLTGEGTPLPLGNSDVLRIGESISIRGYPDGEFKITEGNIQSIRKNNKWLKIETTTSNRINGSPVLDNNGQVIGVIVPYGDYAVSSSVLEVLLAESVPIEPLTAWQQRKQIRAAAYYDLGKEKLDAKDYTGAIVEFDKVIEIDTEHAEAYNNLGLAKLRLGESKTANGNPKEAQRLYKATIEDLTRSIQMDPEDAEPYNNLGLAKFSLGEFKSARGKVKKTQRFYETASADYTQAIKINPKYAEAYENRATVKCKLGDIESARGDAEKGQRLYHEGVTDYDKSIQLDNPEDVDPKAADLEFKKVGDSTVLVIGWIKTLGNFFYGSGFFVDRDKIATNVHVVAQPGPVFVKLKDKAEIRAVEEVTAYDVENDLVVLKIAGGGTPLSLGDSDAVQNGEQIIAVGYPGYRYKVTQGTLHDIQNTDKWLWTKVDTAGGSSGGPALNRNGHVIGIYVASNERYSYAIPSNVLKVLLAEAKSMEPLIEWHKREFIRAYALFIQGQMKYNANHYDEAIVDFDKAIKMNTQYFSPYYKRGEVQFALGNYEAAIVDYDKAIKINDGFFNVYFDRGLAKSKLGDNEAAIVDYDKAIKVDPEYTDAYNNRGVLYDDLGDLESTRGNTEKAQAFYEAAIADYDKVIQMDPERTNTYNNRGVSHDHLGDLESARGNMEKAEAFYEAAIADYDKVIQMDPEYTGIYNNRGVSHNNLGDLETSRGSTEKAQAFYKAAKTDFEKAEALNPENLPDYIARAKQRFSLGEFQAARGNAEKTQELLTAAIEDWTHVIKSAPGEAEAYRGRGLAKLALGDAEGAITDFDKAIEINPESAEVFYSRGQAKQTLGEKEAAQADFQKAKELDPNVGK